MRSLDRIKDMARIAWEGLRRRWSEVRARVADQQDRAGVRALASDPSRLARWSQARPSIVDRGRDFVVSLPLPGMNRNDFDVRVEGDLLWLRAQARASREVTRGAYRVHAFAAQTLERAVRLPMPVDATRTKARYRNGVLEITLPKDRSSIQRIRVQAA